MNVLIICNDFPPLNSIGAQRPYSWFKYFADFGINVTVITKNRGEGSSKPEDIITDQNFKERVEEQTDKGKVIGVPHKLLLPEKLINKYGMDRYTLLRRPLTLIYRFLSFLFPFFDKHSYLYTEANNYVKNNPVDIIVTTGEPFILFKYGHKLKRKFKHIKWVADYRDGWYFNHITIRLTGFLHKLTREYEYYFEKKYLKNSDLVVTVDPMLENRFKDLHQKPTAVVYNGFWEYFVPKSVIRSSTNGENPLILTHLGTLTPGQRVEFLLTAVKKLIGQKRILPGDLIIRFVGLKYYEDREQRVLNYDKEVSKYIDSTLRVPRDEAMEMTYHSDFVLAFTEAKYTAIYAKNYEYLAAKRPVLVLPDDNGLLRDFVSNLEMGLIFNDVEKLCDFLEEKVEQKKRGELKSDHTVDIRKADFYSRENQTKVFANILKEL